MSEKKTFRSELLRVFESYLDRRTSIGNVKGDIDGERILAHLRASERALAARIDALELYVTDVTEKYLKKAESKARYAREKEEGLTVEPINGFDLIRQKYGGRE